jgi:hypothetical protein
LVGDPEVEGKGLLYIEPELGGERLIQSKGNAQLFDRLLGDVAPTEQRSDGVLLDDAEQNEVENEDKDESEERSQHLFQDESGSPLTLGYFGG